MTYRSTTGKRYRRRKSKGRLVFVALLSIGIALGAAFGIHWFLSSRNGPGVDPVGELPKAEQSADLRPEAGAVTVLLSSSDLLARPVSMETRLDGIDPKASYWVRIEKGKFMLSLMREAKVLKTFPVALGKNGGNKEKAGDMRTPEGTFSVERVQDSSAWVHDFGDGKGAIAGAYGPKFIRLKTGWSGIGIHGTHDPASVGKKVTEGCIRLRNEDLAEVAPYVKPGTKVQIDP
jgi:hypothetical protein